MWRTTGDDLLVGRRGVILALETSCDDTCAAVVTGGGQILSNVISSQGIHDRYGGVVPEIASPPSPGAGRRRRRRTRWTRPGPSWPTSSWWR